jgi:hypothetical protein
MMPLERNAVSALNARRELYGANDAANAARLLRFWRQYGRKDRDIRTLHAHHLAGCLPGLVKIEAQQARDAADAIDPRTHDSEKEWRRLHQKAECLDAWAKQCSFESTQEAAMQELRKQLGAETRTTQ